MKKVLFLAVLCMSAIFTVNAQESPLKAYVGKYVFAAGSPVAEVTVTVEDTALMINSAMGSTPIEKKGVDTFYLAQYDASVIFKRGADKSVIELSIMVQGMELVGKKETAAAPGAPIAMKQEELFETIWAEKLIK
jgi:hypothetical protein